MPSGGGEIPITLQLKADKWENGGLFLNDSLIKRGKEKPHDASGFSKELEFKVFVRTVNQAGFSGIFGCFSDIGYSNVSRNSNAP
jgi:hypothetical protein